MARPRDRRAVAPGDAPAPPLIQTLVVRPDDPAVGQPVSLTVPDGEYWRLRSFLFGLQTSAVAGSREPAVLFFDGAGGLAMIVAAPSIVAPSTFQLLQFVAGASGQTVSGELQLGFLPEWLQLPPGWSISAGSDTGGDPGGDQYQSAVVVYEVEPIPAGSYSTRGAADFTRGFSLPKA